MPQQILDHVVGEHDAAAPRVDGERSGLGVVLKRQQLVDEPPAQTRAQVLAQRKGGERRPARRDQPRLPLLDRVVEREQAPRRRFVGQIDAVDRDDLFCRRAYGR